LGSGTKSISTIFLCLIILSSSYFTIESKSSKTKTFLSTSTRITPTKANVDILGSAANYAVLAGATITNSGKTEIYGSVGIHPSINIYGTALIVHDGLFQVATPLSLLAKNDLTTAYNKLAGLANFLFRTGVNLAGKTFTPGVYKWTSNCDFGIGKLTLDAEGDADAEWVFQIGSTLITSFGSEVEMINEGNPLNVYWTIGSSATINANSIMVGNIMAYASISLWNNATIRGRVLARTATINMVSNVINAELPK
jgi:hypothetical protein